MTYYASAARAAVVGLALAAGVAAPAAAQKVLNAAMGAADLGSLDPHRTASTQDKAIIG